MRRCTCPPGEGPLLNLRPAASSRSWLVLAGWSRMAHTKISLGSLYNRIKAIAPVLAPLVLHRKASSSLRDVSSLGATPTQKKDIARVVDSLRNTSTSCAVCGADGDLVSSPLWSFDSKEVSLQLTSIQVCFGSYFFYFFCFSCFLIVVL